MKLSYCTPIRDRLSHLKIVFPVSIRESCGFDVEFIISDAGSEDGLRDWLFSSFPNELESGLVKYFRTPLSEYWEMAKEKNVAHSFASGQILCNLDADNVVTKEFNENVFKIFSEDLNSILDFQARENFGGGCGRVALSAENFKRLGGYDESFAEGWGYDDTDIIGRAVALDVKRVFGGGNSLIFVTHSNDLRVKYVKNKDFGGTLLSFCEKSKENIRNGKFVANLPQ